jgi:hypothetical protein
LWRLLLTAAFLGAVLIQFRSNESGLRKSQEPEPGACLFRALFWLKDHSKPSDVVLTDWENGAQVVAHAERPVIVTSKVYPSEVRKAAERYRDSRHNFNRAASE